jgi:hypothetical protein
MFFTSVPTVILTSLIFFGVLKCEEMDDSSNIVLIIALNIFNLLKLYIMKFLDKLAAGESFVFYFYEGMTAYVNWLAHLSKIKPKESFHLNYGTLKTSLPLVTTLFGFYYSIVFQFTSKTLGQL